jgi:hypothetical protein
MGSKIGKKLAPYDMSMKQIKRYTPVDYTVSGPIEVHHLTSLQVPGTSRRMYSSTNSKGSNSSGNSKYWSSQHIKYLRNNIGHKTITEEKTRETSCNKDSNLYLGSFEVPSQSQRFIIDDNSHMLTSVKNKVEYTLNSYKKY